MSDLTIDERCCCGATIRVTGTTYRSNAGGGTNAQHRGAEEVVERWRDQHDHHAAPIARRVSAKSVRTRRRELEERR